MKKAIILAGGIGSRLQPITGNKPKTMVEVNGVPMLGHILSALESSKVNEIVLVCGYLSDQIRDYCIASFPNLNFSFVEDKLHASGANNLHGLYLASKHLTDDILIMNGDLVFDASIIKKLAKSRETSIAVDVDLYQDESMKVVVINGCITRISKSITPEEAYGCSIDIYKFSKKDLPILVKELTRTVKAGNIGEWTEAAFDRLFSSGQIEPKVCPIGNSRWFEIDTIDDHIDAEIKFNSKLKLLRKKKVFFIDNDGTLTLGSSALAGSKAFINTLRKNNKKFYVLTNNSSRTPTEMVQSMKKTGLLIKKDEILISTHAAMLFLKQKRIKKIFWVTNKKAEKFLIEEGFVFEGKKPQAVLLCYDTELTYKKVTHAIKHIYAGVPYYATHIDQVCPTKDGFLPDIGTFIDMIKASTGKMPLKTFGKPLSSFINPVLKKLNIAAKDAVVIGDRLYTDIQLAKNTGALSVLVLSGEVSRADYEKSEVKADIVVRNVSELSPYL